MKQIVFMSAWIAWAVSIGGPTYAACPAPYNPRIAVGNSDVALCLSNKDILMEICVADHCMSTAHDTKFMDLALLLDIRTDLRTMRDQHLATANTHLEGVNKKLGALSTTSTALSTTSEETNSQILALATAVSGLTAEMKAYREMVEKQVLDAKAEMLKRIDNLPLEMTQDEDAYKLLKARLETDLAESFARRSD